MMLKKNYNREDNCISVKFYPDMSVFDDIDIDGPDNTMSYMPSLRGRGAAGDTMTNIYIPSDNDMNITTDNGKFLRVVNGDISGTINVVSTDFIV